ncbi:MAG: hypothetical protein BWX92_02491 [Deltaproteobacteria bacterium ADurb.Bin135]|nr:MAG: hypothetical protein BWX92_02491 [Deltaproteobacteria bacterium ADurb.Bin135]
MRIDELEFRSFGPFTGFKVVLPARDMDFHVIYGRNEAGKSSALRALKSLFFGIPHHTSDNFLHDSAKLRVAGRLRNSEGSGIALMRRKGTKNTLLDLNENPIDESVIKQLLSGVSEEMFEAFFGISHDTLSSGSQSILNEGGDVGRSLFSAGMGGVDVKNILLELENEANAIFLPKGQKQMLNKALNEYADIKKLLQSEALPGRKWLELNEELKKVSGERDELSKTIGAASREKNRLTRLMQALPDIALIEKATSELGELGDVVTVNEDFGKIRKKYTENLRIANDAEERSTAGIAKLKDNMNLITVPQDLLDQAETIEELHQRLGSYRKGLQDLGRLKGNIQQLDQDIEILVSEIGIIVKDRPNASLKAKIQDLGGRYQSLLDALKRSDLDIIKIETELAGLKKELQSLDVPGNISALKSALTRARKRGDLAATLEETKRSLIAEEKQVALDVDRLPLFTGTIEELESVSIPAPETIDRFEAEFQEIAAKIAGLDEKEKEAHADFETVGLKMETLRIEGAVPTEDDLVQARSRRDAGWSLVLRSWKGHEEIDEEAASFDSEDKLPRAYEKSVVNADEVSDRLRREADRVAQYASLAAWQAAIKQNLVNSEEIRKQLGSRLSALVSDWSEQWKPAGINPLTPKEMRSWIARHTAILQKTCKVRELRQACNVITRQLYEHKNELIACLKELGRETDENATFDALVDYCQMVVDNVEDISRRKIDLEKKANKLENEAKLLDRNHNNLKEEFTRWNSDWQNEIVDLGLKPETSPPQVYAVLSKIDELFKKKDDRKSFERRIYGINRDAEDFRADVKTVVEKISPELSDMPVEEVVSRLNISLGKAKTDSAMLADMKKRLIEQEEILNDAEETIRHAIKQLQLLCDQTGCGEYDGLEEVEKKSEHKKQLQEKISGAENRLLKIGGGMSITELVNEAKGVDADSLPVKITEIENQVAVMEVARSDIDQRIGGMQTILSQMDGSAKAADKADQAQQVLSFIRNCVERYVRLRMCSSMLNREIERYRSENQNPLLQRAGRIFSDLTLKSFSGLAAEFNDKDEPVIAGIRHSGEKIGVQGMSDGTRDQLFLALRIASLEKYLDANEPMPFIVDDILIRFDDDRASAALRVLSNLSQKTQVIFLTHHARLLELVQTSLFCESPTIYSL